MNLLVLHRKSAALWFFENGEGLATFLLGRQVDQYQVYALVDLVLPADPAHHLIKAEIDDDLQTVRLALREYIKTHGVEWEGGV